MSHHGAEACGSSDAHTGMGGLAQGPSQSVNQLPGAQQLPEPVAAGRVMRAGSIRLPPGDYQAFLDHEEHRAAQQQERDFLQGHLPEEDINDLYPPVPSYAEKTGRVSIPGASHGPRRASAELPGNGQLLTGPERDILLRAIVPNLEHAYKNKRLPKISIQYVLQTAREDPDFRQVFGEILARKKCDNRQAVASIRTILRSEFKNRKHFSRN